MNVAIIGAGFIGSKRASSQGKNDKLVMVCDTKISAAKELSRKYNSTFTDEYQQVANNTVIDVAFMDPKELKNQVKKYCSCF